MQTQREETKLKQQVELKKIAKKITEQANKKIFELKKKEKDCRKSIEKMMENVNVLYDSKKFENSFILDFSLKRKLEENDLQEN